MVNLGFSAGDIFRYKVHNPYNEWAQFILTIAVTPCISSLSMCGSEKNRGITRRFEQCTLSVFRRLQDSNWEWSLYGVERDPDVGISSVRR